MSGYPAGRGNPARAFKPAWQEREWRFRRVEQTPLYVRLPDKIVELRSIDQETIDALVAVEDAMVRAVDVGGVRWSDTLCGWVSSANRSPAAADAIRSVLDKLDEYHAAILAQLDVGHWDAIVKVRELVATSGYRVVHDIDYGGLVAVPDGQRAEGEIPTWRLKEEIDRLRRSMEHKIGRRLTASQVEQVLRPHAEQRLARLQNVVRKAFGIDLARYESLRRMARRQRRKDADRRAHMRVELPLEDRVIQALLADPTATRNTLAKNLGVRPKRVSEALRIMRKDGRIRYEGGRYVPDPDRVPPYIDQEGGRMVRVADPKLRVAVDDDSDGLDEELELLDRPLNVAAIEAAHTDEQLMHALMEWGPRQRTGLGGTR